MGVKSGGHRSDAFLPHQSIGREGSFQDPFRNTVFDWLIPTKHGIFNEYF